MAADELDKQYYKIREVSDLLNIPTTTIRYWESQFNILKPQRNDKGTRFYTPADIDRIRMVKYLIHDRGMRIEKAKEVIKHNHSGVSKRFKALERLQDVRNRLAAILASIDNNHR